MCADAYQSYACVEAIVFSMIFNPDLDVQDKLRQKQSKDRERAELANPFTTKRVKERGKERKAEEAVSWKLIFSSITAPQVSSAVVMAMAKRAARPAAEEEPDVVAPVDQDPLLRPVNSRRLIALASRGAKGRKSMLSLDPACAARRSRGISAGQDFMFQAVL